MAAAPKVLPRQPLFPFGTVRNPVCGPGAGCLNASNSFLNCRKVRASCVLGRKTCWASSSFSPCGCASMARVPVKVFAAVSDVAAAARRLYCECCCAAAANSSHLNFHLPSKSFGFERGTFSCDLDCKPASYNPHFGGAERAGKQQQQQDSHPSFGFHLHDLMDQAGIETTHARVARVGFTEEVAKLGNEALATQSTELVDVNLARAALEISAEDDALVSHSSVPLPVDSYLERLDNMATEFAGHHLPACSVDVFGALDNYLWNYKGFRSTKSRTGRDARDFYLNGVLTRRQGPPLMLGLIYSEVVKRLWRSGTIDFLVDMDIPVDDISFPLPIYKDPGGPFGRNLEDKVNRTNKQWTLTSDSPDLKDLNQNLLTPKNVLSEVLKSLKKLYWPWRSITGSGEGSGFLEAATAASRGTVSSASSSHGPFESLFNAPSSERGSEVARARAAQYRLQRGIWTSTTFGDLRRALAASERLVILGDDNQEHRDYGMLLFHAGLYEQAYQYLSYYSNYTVSIVTPLTFNAFKQIEAKEAVALQHLLDRLRLIITERSWNTSDPPPIVPPPDPW